MLIDTRVAFNGPLLCDDFRSPKVTGAAFARTIENASTLFIIPHPPRPPAAKDVSEEIVAARPKADNEVSGRRASTAVS